MSFSPAGPVEPGDIVILDINETNDGTIDLAASFVDVWHNNVKIATLTPGSPSFQGVDNVVALTLDIGENWQWLYNVAVNPGDSIQVIGHGNANGLDVTFCEGGNPPSSPPTLCDQDEEATVSFQGKSVGGVTEFFAAGSGSSSGSIALLAGGIAAVVAIATVGGWYTRRRWMGNKLA